MGDGRPASSIQRGGNAASRTPQSTIHSARIHGVKESRLYRKRGAGRTRTRGTRVFTVGICIRPPPGTTIRAGGSPDPSSRVILTSGRNQVAAKYRVGVIGHTGRGNYGHGLDRVWLTLDDCEIVGVADADEGGLKSAVARLKAPKGILRLPQIARRGEAPRSSPSVPAGPISIATWSSPPRSGGIHIYMEKPMWPLARGGRRDDRRLREGQRETGHRPPDAIQSPNYRPCAISFSTASSAKFSNYEDAEKKTAAAVGKTCGYSAATL